MSCRHSSAIILTLLLLYSFPYTRGEEDLQELDDTKATTQVPVKEQETPLMEGEAEADQVKKGMSEAEASAVETTTEGTETTTEEEEEEFGFWNVLGGLKKTKATEAAEEEVTTLTVLEERKAGKLSDQIREVLKSYRESGVVTLPGKPFPDPLLLPNVNRKFAGNPVNFSNVVMHGMSDFYVDQINTDLEKMQVYVALNINRLMVLGNYSVRSWFTRASGPFNVTLLQVVLSGSAELNRDEEGNLKASDLELDMMFIDVVVDFQNTGMLGSILQSIMASAGTVLFEAIKPTVLAQVNDKVKEQMNTRIQSMGTKLGSEKPLDLAVAEGRKYVRENGYDPYHLQSVSVTEGLFQVNVTDLWVKGLSQFYRVGNVSLSMDGGLIQAGVRLATKKLFGKCRWSVSFKTLAKHGATNFTVEHLQVRALVKQSVDFSKHPVLEDLDLNLGKIKIRMERNDRLDIVIEFLINSLPDLLRHIIVDALEEPMKIKVQEILDTVDMEGFIEKQLPELDNMGV